MYRVLGVLNTWSTFGIQYFDMALLDRDCTPGWTIGFYSSSTTARVAEQVWSNL